MQGTVKEFQEETRSGSVVLDDGTVIPLPAAAFSATGLLTLRPGQRVNFGVRGDGDDRVVSTISLVTF